MAAQLHELEMLVRQRRDTAAGAIKCWSCCARHMRFATTACADPAPGCLQDKAMWQLADEAEKLQHEIAEAM